MNKEFYISFYALYISNTKSNANVLNISNIKYRHIYNSTSASRSSRFTFYIFLNFPIDLEFVKCMQSVFNVILILQTNAKTRTKLLKVAFST